MFALHQPALGLRAEIRSSAILPRLLDAVPPDSVLQALNRFDPLPLLPGLEETLPPPDPSVLQSPAARAAARSVVKLQGDGVRGRDQGSGWVVRPGLVATNAHVIAGHESTSVLAPNGQMLLGTAGLRRRHERHRAHAGSRARAGAAGDEHQRRPLAAGRPCSAIRGTGR